MPFDTEIQEAEFLEKIKVPKIRQFDVISDSQKHLDVYLTEIYLWLSSSQTMMCRYFSATLIEVTYDYFRMLLPTSVKS